MRRKLTVWLDSEHQLQHVTIAKQKYIYISSLSCLVTICVMLEIGCMSGFSTSYLRMNRQ